MTRTPGTPRLSLRRMLFLALLLPPAVALLNFAFAFACAFADAESGGKADDTPVSIAAPASTPRRTGHRTRRAGRAPGKILQIGSEDEVKVPANAQVRDLSARSSSRGWSIPTPISASSAGLPPAPARTATK